MINLHIVRNSVIYDSRVLKETESIHKSGIFDTIEICGFQDSKDDPEYDSLLGRKVWRVALNTRKLPQDLFSLVIKYLEWHFRVIQTYSDRSISVIHCHDLEPLPIAVHLKFLTGAKLIYDAHELETERIGGYPGLTNGLSKWMTKILERLMISWIDAMITVSPSIQKWYQTKYPLISCGLVRNVPKRIDQNIKIQNLRQILNISDDVLLFIYLGALIKGRGIEKMLSAFSNDNVSHHLLFMGYGSLVEDIKSAISVCNKIHYLDPVSPSQVVEYAMGADVGISLIEDMSLSYRYCLPNKLFEYLIAGLPVLVSNVPDQKRLVSDYNAGWVTDTNNIEAIVDSLLLISREEYESVKSGLKERTQDLDWEYEVQKLLDIYSDLFNAKKER